MNGKGKKTKKQAINSNSAINVLSQEELSRRIAVVETSLKASNWRELEAKGKFSKNDKLTSTGCTGK